MDTVFYNETARRVAAGLGYTSVDGTPTALFPPGYPTTLALLYRLAGANVAVAQAFNLVLSAGIVLLTYAVGRMTVGRRVALIAAALWAVFPSQILWNSLVMSELWFTLTCLAALAFTLQAERTKSPVSRFGLAAAAGGAAGLALLTRGQAIALCFVIVGWLLLHRRGRQRWLAGVFLLATVATVTPWTIRNARQLDAFVPISTTVGWNAAIGHSEYATGGFWSPISVGLFGEHYFDPYPAREVAFHRAGLRLAWDWAQHHRYAELRLCLAKARLLWEADDDAIAWQELGGAGALSTWEHAHLPQIVNGFYLAVACIAGMSLLAGLTQRRPWATLALLLLVSTTAFHMLFFAANRYHYPLLPLLCLAAAEGLRVAGTTLVATTRVVRRWATTSLSVTSRNRRWG
jgi:4-amino-4-deoxy-L-arabinose transferase-like glycosyltransferase